MSVRLFAVSLFLLLRSVLSSAQTPSPSLQETADFIRDHIVTSVKSTCSSHFSNQYGTVNDDSTTETAVISGFNIDPQSCMVKLTETSSQVDASSHTIKGKGTQSSDRQDWKVDFEWSLKGVDVDHIEIQQNDLSVTNEAICVSVSNSYSGDRWSVLGFPLKPGTATQSRNGTAPLPLKQFQLRVESDAMAKRMQKALVHAVVLCGGAKLEPF